MTVISLQNWMILFTIGFMSVFLSCLTKGTEHKLKSKMKNKLDQKSHFDLCDKMIASQNAILDTISVSTSDELRNQIQNNRVILLLNKSYIIESTLLIDNMNNLKIIGTDSSKLWLTNQNTSALTLRNSNHINIENIIIGQSPNQGQLGEQGIIRIEHSSNLTVSNCKITGTGTFGLITKDVCRLKFDSLEITKCTALIFELEKSQGIEFTNSIFQNNYLATSVLGGFTNSTKDVKFTNCKFVNNQPYMKGNPVFNFENNYQNLDEKIIFSNCTFSNNKGYKWYGDKIKLIDCQIDSLDFIGLKVKN